LKCLDKRFKLWMQVCIQKLNTLVNFSFKLRWLYLYLCRYLLPNCCLKHLILLCLLLNHTWVKTETGSKNGQKCPKKGRKPPTLLHSNLQFKQYLQLLRECFWPSFKMIGYQLMILLLQPIFKPVLFFMPQYLSIQLLWFLVPLKRT